MGEELTNALPEVPQAGDGQGQAAGDGGAAEAPKMVPATDLDALRSVKDREVAEAKRIAAENERRAREAAQQAMLAQQQASAYKRLVESADPNVIKQVDEQLINQAKVTQLEEENAYYRRIAEIQRFENEVIAFARDELKLDPNDQRVLDAKAEAARTGSDEPFRRLKSEIEIDRRVEQKIAERLGQQPAQATEANSVSSTQAPVEKPKPKTGVATPPSGGAPSGIQQQGSDLLDEFEQKALAARRAGDMGKVRALSNEYRQKFRERNLTPPF